MIKKSYYMSQSCYILINRMFDYYGNLGKKFEDLAVTINSFRAGEKAVFIENVDKDLNNMLNIFALLELIDVASGEISIYTDYINPNTLDQKIVIDSLVRWIRLSGVGEVNILLKKKPQEDKLHQTYLYQQIKANNDIQKHIRIKYVDDSVTFSPKFNVLIADEAVFKIKCTSEENINKICLSGSDVELSRHIKAVFNRYFNKHSENATPELRKYFFRTFNLLTLINYGYKVGFNNKYKKPAINSESYFNANIARLFNQDEQSYLMLKK